MMFAKFPEPPHKHLCGFVNENGKTSLRMQPIINCCPYIHSMCQNLTENTKVNIQFCCAGGQTFVNGDVLHLGT